jgi:Transcriptional regulatory protein, C terminal
MPPAMRSPLRSDESTVVWAEVTEGVSRIGVLGPFTLEQHGGSVPLPSGRQRSLLALFLMAGGVPLSRDRLIDELWGERPPASAVSALHVHLSKVRDLARRATNWSSACSNASPFPESRSWRS